MKKITKILVAIILAVCTCCSSFACAKPTDNFVNDGKTVNVRVFLAGYGVDWLYGLKDKFEAAYAEEGYKINILTPSNSVQTTVVINELYNGGNGVDLYFPGSVWTNQVTAGGEFGVNLVEDISDSVFAKPAIGFDGKEESVTIREKVKSDVLTEYNCYYEGKEYGFPTTDSPSGLAVNTDRLELYGFDLPRTTDELLTIFDSVMLGKDKDGNNVGTPSQTGIYPHTFVSGVSGYPVMMYDNWVAQYMGLEKWREFNSYERVGDPDYYKTNGYEIYADQSILEMLKVMYQVFDLSYATKGSNSQNAEAANFKMIDPDSGAIFFSTASWMINEVKNRYPEESKALRMINYPVVSALGTKVFGAGTSANITDSKKCDKVLSETIKLVDENKTNAEVVAAINSTFSINATESDVARIREARLMYVDRAYEGGAYITKDSPVKDIAALFLRMFASDDNATLHYDTVGTNTLYDKVSVRENGYQFSKDVINIGNREGSISINCICSTGLRKKVGHASTILASDSYIQLKVANSGVSKWVFENNDFRINGKTGNEVYHAAAQEAFNVNKAYMQQHWNEWMASVK